MINKVEISGVNTANLPVLSNDEKKELLLKIKSGDKNARKRFINGNLKLVLSVIKRFKNYDENADDLFQIGCIGLIKAIDNFDVSQNVQFSTYAVPMIIGEMKRYIRDNNPIRVSRSVRELAYKALIAKNNLYKKTQVEPTVEQIAKSIGVSKEEVAASIDAIQDPISLQETVHGANDSDNLYVMDQVSDKKGNDENWINSIAISQAVDKLNSREKDILKRRFFDCKTQIEIADEIGISQAQVSRLEKNAIDHLRRNYL
jgi:RNA polymerase sporulation-specific sigma factor